MSALLRTPCGRCSVDFFINNWTLIAIAVGSGAMLMWPSIASGGGSGAADPAGGGRLVNSGKAVGDRGGQHGRHGAREAGGARNVPMAELNARLPEMVKNKATPVILVCASGMRSRGAVAIARKLGYEKAHSLAGGMGAWRAASLPVEKA